MAKDDNVFALERLLIFPRFWGEHKSKLKLLLPDDLFKELFVDEICQPTGLGLHPEKGYFILGTGQGPFIIWTQWDKR